MNKIVFFYQKNNGDYCIKLLILFTQWKIYFYDKIYTCITHDSVEIS